MRSKVLNEGPERTFAVVFDSGDEVASGLARFAREQNLDASRFTAIGAFESVILGYFDWEKKDYERIPVNEQVEVLALIGDVALDGGKPEVHAHVVIGLREWHSARRAPARSARASDAGSNPHGITGVFKARIRSRIRARADQDRHVRAASCLRPGIVPLSVSNIMRALRARTALCASPLTRWVAFARSLSKADRASRPPRPCMRTPNWSSRPTLRAASPRARQCACAAP